MQSNVERGAVAAACVVITALTFSCADGEDSNAVQGYVATSDDVRLYYEKVGNGPQIVVVPAGAFLSDALSSLASEHRTLVFYDPRNRARSDAADLSTVSLERQILDLEDLRTQLDIERMSLIGWSGLGMEMAAYALRHPERVERLVQIAPVPPRDGMLAEAGGDTRPNRMDAAALESLQARVAAGEFETDPAAYCRELRAISLPSNFVDAEFAGRVPDLCVHENEWPVNLFPYFDALLTSFEGYDWLPGLATSSVNRLVIHGEGDGIPIAGARAWVRGFPNARMITLSTSGHFPFLEQAEATLSAIDLFLDGEWPAAARTLQ